MQYIVALALPLSRLQLVKDFVAMPELPQEAPKCLSSTEWRKQLQTTWPVFCQVLDEARNLYKNMLIERGPHKRSFVWEMKFISTKYLQSRQPLKKLGSKFMGPFPIIRIVNPVIFELRLPKNFRRIPPIFHCSLLKPEKKLSYACL